MEGTIGLALMFGLRRIVDVAHGALYMPGAYLGCKMAKLRGFWAALAAAALDIDRHPR